MISPAEAAKKVKETQNYEEVLRVKDYDAQHYVVEAWPIAGKMAHGEQTTFGVDKNTGAVTAFMMNPGTGTLDKFLNAKDCDI